MNKTTKATGTFLAGLALGAGSLVGLDAVKTDEQEVFTAVQKIQGRYYQEHGEYLQLCVNRTAAGYEIIYDLKSGLASTTQQ